MEVVVRDVNDLWGCSPRKLTIIKTVKLRQSIDKHGVVNPLIIRQDGKVFYGCDRLIYMKEKGLKQANCLIVGSKEEAIKARQEHYERISWR